MERVMARFVGEDNRYRLDLHLGLGDGQMALMRSGREMFAAEFEVKKSCGERMFCEGVLTDRDGEHPAQVEISRGAGGNIEFRLYRRGTYMGCLIVTGRDDLILAGLAREYGERMGVQFFGKDFNSYHDLFDSYSEEQVQAGVAI